jgi:hypothetical protein
MFIFNLYCLPPLPQKLRTSTDSLSLHIHTGHVHILVTLYKLTFERYPIRYLTEMFRGIPHSLQANAGEVPSNKPSRAVYVGVSKSFRTESITKYMLTTINTRWEATKRVMATKLTRLTHKIAIQLHLVAEGCTISSSRFRWPVRKLLDTPSNFQTANYLLFMTTFHSHSTVNILCSWVSVIT